MWSLTQMKKNYRYYRDICCKFCKMCVKLKSFVVKKTTLFLPEIIGVDSCFKLQNVDL